MIIPKELIEDAKQKLGERGAFIIAKDLGLEQFDEKNLKSICKWHHEETPSLIWNPKDNAYKCFGCGKVYGIIDHYMSFDGLTFLGATQKLFELVNVDYKFGERGVKSREYSYPEYTPDDNRDLVNEYFLRRKISKETLDYFDIKQYQGKVAFNFYDGNDVLTSVKLRHARKPEPKEQKEWFLPGYDNKPILFGMNKVDPTKPLVITEGQCFTGDAEVLTPDGWVRLDKYDGQEVLQVDKYLNANFVTPQAYIKKQYTGEIYIVGSAKKKYYSAMTEDHNFVCYHRSGSIVKVPIRRLSHRRSNMEIPTAVSVDGSGIGLSDEQIKLHIATNILAEINTRKDGLVYAVITIDTGDKYDRLKETLDVVGIPYYDRPASTGSGLHKFREYKYIGFTVPDWLSPNGLPMRWIGETSFAQKDFILNEVLYWEDNYKRLSDKIELFTSSENNANFIQTMATTRGMFSMKRRITSPDSSEAPVYRVRMFFDESSVTMRGEKFSRREYCGMVYCVTVPTGMFLVRQLNKISVTGNCDAMAVFEAGYSNVVSIPSGTENKKFIEECWDWLEQFDKIILWYDNDAPGTKARKEVANRLGTWRTLFVDMPPFITRDDGKIIACKDANELLYFFGKNKVIGMIEGAEEIPVSGVTNLSSVPDFNIAEADGLYTKLKPLDNIVYKFLMGSVIVLTGKRGSGKSSLANQVFVCEPLNQGYDVFYYSGELDARVLRSWIDINLAGEENVTEEDGGAVKIISGNAKEKMSDWYNNRVWIYDNHSHKAKDIIDTGINVTRKYGAKVWVLDNLMMMDLESESDMSSVLQKQKEFIASIVRIAQTYGVLIVLAIHPRKSSPLQSELVADDVSGSGDLTNMSQYVISVRRFTDKEKQGIPDNRGGYKKGGEPIPHDVAVEVLKNRYTGKNGVAMLDFNYTDYRFSSNEEELYKRYKWNKDTSPYRKKKRGDVAADFFMD